MRSARNLPKIINEKDKTIKTFKTSGHFIDQKLKNNYQTQQMGLFNILESDLVKEKIRNTDCNIDTLIQGIHLTQAEDRLLNCIIKILNEKSDKNLHGNMSSELHPYGPGEAKYPRLHFEPHELYKEYCEQTKMASIQSNSVDFIKRTLNNLANRKFLIIYKRHRWEMENGKKIEKIDRIEEFQSLFKVIRYYEGLTTEEDTLLQKNDVSVTEKGRVVLLLNPIFIDQIDTKFIEFPADINKRTALASGGAKMVTESIIKLRDFLIRAIAYSKCSKKTKAIIKINREKLIYLLHMEKHISSGRRKYLETRIQKSHEAMMNLGVIFNYKSPDERSGRDCFEYELNLDFPYILEQKIIREDLEAQGVVFVD